MGWKGLIESRQDLSRHDSQRVRSLFALAHFADSAFYPSSFTTHDGWAHAVVPSEAGEAVRRHFASLFARFSAAEQAFALFRALYHHEVLVDIEKSDSDAIRALIGSALSDGTMRLPNRFGRELYDRFNDSAVESRTDFLEHSEAQLLLADSSQGVYQAGELIAGPLGILPAANVRYTPASTRLPLWHCSDTGCRALHNVELRPAEDSVAAFSDALSVRLTADFGPPSEYHRVFLDLCRAPTNRGRRLFYDLPAVLAEALAPIERTDLFLALLHSSQAGRIRQLLADTRSKDILKGSPAAISERLADNERLQLLLTLDDPELVRLLDRAVASRSIRIPLFETRHANLRPPRTRSTDLPSELSALGLRARHPRPHLQLATTIWDAYSEAGKLEELGWAIRKRTGIPPRSALGEYLQRVEPADALRELVLPVMPVALHVAHSFDVDLGEDAEQARVLDRLLWKMGFHPPLFEIDLSLLRERTQHFSDTLHRIGVVRNETDRAAIRAAGVNLFVSVEHFLEDLVSFNVWLLSSDHFIRQFRYSRADALEAVTICLGESVEAGSDTLWWDAAGSNALGTLLVFLVRARDWVQRLDHSGMEAVARPEADLPHFAESPERVFPFRHTQLWADADPTALRQYSIALSTIVDQLNRAKIAEVRNGLDHKRPPEEFPSIDVMIACASRLREACDAADMARLVPKAFWIIESTADRNGRTTSSLTDYMGRVVQISGPPLVASLPALTFDSPVILPPGDLLGHLGAELRFRVVEASAHSEYWTGYPRRRKVASRHEHDTVLP